MNCSNCGLFNPAGAQACSACHTLLAGVVPVSAPPVAIPIAPVVSPELKWGVFAGTLVIPLIGFVMGIVYLAANAPHKKSTGLLWLLTSIFAPFLFWRMIFL